METGVGTEQDPRHVVAIVGGAVAGSEAAFQLAERGILCVVLDQNDRPYGKIEDGLPRWHVGLRQQEEEKIDKKLSHPNVWFVPRTKLGPDISLTDLLGWGCSAIVLANGAWRDRPFPVEGADQYVGRGFYYQNPLVYWFNHYPEPTYQGPQIAIEDPAIIVGGGLASLDVVKIVQLETMGRALRERGIVVDPYEMERRGIKKTLEEKGLSMEALGLVGCMLFYRRQVEDMPLAEPPDNATQEQIQKTRSVRRRILENFRDKYLFRFRDRHAPVDLIVEGDRLVGLRFVETEVRDGRAMPIPGSEKEIRSPMVISSIGSIPEPLDRIQMRGELYRIKDQQTGEVEGLEGVFAMGNSVTGKGNILVSLKHGRVVSQHMLENYLLGKGSGYEEVLADAAAEAREKAEAVMERIFLRPPLAAPQVAWILEKVQTLQARVGFPGDYVTWIEQAKIAGAARSSTP